ncbi:hypothetical protein B0H13DRAFT_2523946, partial [Mycena leptocephala]
RPGTSPCHRYAGRPRSSAPRNATAHSKSPPASRPMTPVLHLATLPAPFLARTSHIGLTSSTHQIDATQARAAFPSRALDIDSEGVYRLPSSLFLSVVLMDLRLFLSSSQTPSAAFVLAALGLVRPIRDGERSLLVARPTSLALHPSPTASCGDSIDSVIARDTAGGGDPAIPDVRCTAGRHVVVSRLIGPNFGTPAVLQTLPLPRAPVWLDGVTRDLAAPCLSGAPHSLGYRLAACSRIVDLTSAKVLVLD